MMICAFFIIIQVSQVENEPNIGYFEFDKLTGSKILVGPKGDNYSGEFKNCTKDGYGIMNYPLYSEKVSYEGNWKNNDRSGHGKTP